MPRVITRLSNDERNTRDFLALPAASLGRLEGGRLRGASPVFVLVCDEGFAARGCGSR